MKKRSMKLKVSTIFLILLLISGLLMTGCSKNEEPEPEEEVEVEEEPEPEPEPEPETIWDSELNYLTGLSWENTSSADSEENTESEATESGAEDTDKYLPLRPVAIVVENLAPARPQWGMDDAEYSPDIILEGEVEGGISRMLWFYADYHNLPTQIGPMRSARPPYIRFSELFDSIFIHWGLSHSKGNYVGADSVFENDAVDHIGDSVNGLYGRDNSRNVDIEHRGVMYSELLPGAIDTLGFRTRINEDNFTVLPFNDDVTPLNGEDMTEISVFFSGRSSYSHWTYSEETGTYFSDSYRNNVQRDNIIILYDTTEYIFKDNYGGSGSGVTYCDYLFTGGDGIYLNGGKSVPFNWEVQDGKIIFTDSDGNPFNFNPGKSWIGWISSNNGGYTA